MSLSLVERGFVFDTPPAPSPERLVLSILFFFSATRLTSFFAVGSVGLEDGILSQLFVAGYILSPLVGVLFLLYQRPYPHLLFVPILTLLYLLVGLVPSHGLRLVLGFVFGILSFAYLLSVLFTDFQRLGSVDRFRSLLLAFLLDVLVRIPSLGTEPIIPQTPSSFLSLFLFVAMVGLLAGGFLGRTKPIMSDPQQELSPVMTALVPLVLMLPFFFTLNLGAYLPYLPSLGWWVFPLVSLGMVVFMAPQMTDKVGQFLFAKPMISWVAANVLIAGAVLFSSLGTLLHPLFMFLATADMAFMAAMSPRFLTKTRYDSSPFVAGLVAMVSQLVIILLAAGILYGAPTFLILLPFLVYSLTRRPLADLPSLPKPSLPNVRPLFYTALALGLVALAIPLTLLSLPPTEEPSPSPLVVGTYNVRYAASNSGDYNIREVARVIAEAGVTIVGLQEVTQASVLSGFGNYYLQLKYELASYGFVHSAVLDKTTGVLYNALFSKFPLLNVESIIFDENMIYQRGFLKAEVEVGGVSYCVVTTHLTHDYSTRGNETRLSQVNQVLDYLANQSLPTIITGDFNLLPHDEGIQLMTESFKDSWLVTNQSTAGLTWPANNPIERLDYIFSKGVIASTTQVLSTTASDHLPVVAWF